jgi:hypothetical protein
MEADTGYIKEIRTGTYDHNAGYLKNGVYYEIIPETRTHEFIFGIAWMNNCTDEKVVQTWFGADPTLFK